MSALSRASFFPEGLGGRGHTLVEWQVTIPAKAMRASVPSNRRVTFLWHTDKERLYE